MFRKLLVIAAAVAIPASAVAGVSAMAASSVAGASGALTVTPVTCVVGGSVTFGVGGISEGATVSTATTTTSTSVLTHVAAGSSAGCQTTSQTTKIAQATQKCNVTTLAPLPPSAGALAGQTPGFTHFPLCTAHPTDSQQGSAWGFLGGVQKSGVYVSTTAGIKNALKAGVKFKDGSTTLTLLVSSVTASNPTSSGAACGTSDAGFVLSGTVKGATTHHWNVSVCLSGDVTTGATHTNFLSDLLNLEGSTHSDTSPTNPLHITKAIVDSSVSKLTIT